MREYVSNLRAHLDKQYTNEDFEIIVFSDAFTDGLFTRMLVDDLLNNEWTLLFLVTIYWIHLRSIFLAVVLLLTVLFSYPLTVFTVRNLFNVQYFNQFQFTIIFVAIHVGTNCAYCFIDAWRQSLIVDQSIIKEEADENKPAELKKRMAYALRRTTSTTLISTVTTASMMIPNIFSIIMPMKSYGIFSTTIIVIVWLLVLIVVPPAAIIYDQYMKNTVPLLMKMFKKVSEKVMKKNAEGQMLELPRPEIKTEIVF